MKTVLLLVACAALTACASAPPAQTHAAAPAVAAADAGLPHDLQWFRNSAEYTASAQTIYNAATAQLALLPDRCAAKSEPPWVIVMDADETIFDNSDQQVDWFQRGKAFDAAEWNAWVGKGHEGLIPGVGAFVGAVAARCGHIVVVTNRSERNPKFPVDECKATEDRLHALFAKVVPRNPIDAVMCAPVGPDGKPRNDKNPRFRAIARGEVAHLKNARIAMYIGDSITDLPNTEACPSQTAMDDLDPLLGRTYFVLPNPTYGGWTQCTTPRRGPAVP